jgi:hypothetical protein
MKPNNIENTQAGSDCSGVSCCASSRPRLRCTEKWSNGFYITYKGHRAVIERDSDKSPWAFLVMAPDGGILADGYTKRPMSMQEAIIHALTSACLLHNANVKASVPMTRSDTLKHQ